MQLYRKTLDEIPKWRLHLYWRLGLVDLAVTIDQDGEHRERVVHYDAEGVRLVRGSRIDREYPPDHVLNADKSILLRNGQSSYTIEWQPYEEYRKWCNDLKSWRVPPARKLLARLRG